MTVVPTPSYSGRTPTKNTSLNTTGDLDEAPTRRTGGVKKGSSLVFGSSDKSKITKETRGRSFKERGCS